MGSIFVTGEGSSGDIVVQGTNAKISGSSSSTGSFGKLSVGRQRRLKSEFSLFKLSLFSVFKSNVSSELDEIFLRMS